ncbi:MAG: hypothetical protein ACJ74J_13050 [Blastocatellia bacterium]
MAMKALTAVAPRARRPIAPARIPRSPVCDWRELLIRQDAETIWHRLSALVRLGLPEQPAQHDAITQEIFLDLLSGERINAYLEQDYSSEEIRQEIKTFISGAKKSRNKD